MHDLVMLRQSWSLGTPSMSIILLLVTIAKICALVTNNQIILLKHNKNFARAQLALDRIVFIETI